MGAPSLLSQGKGGSVSAPSSASAASRSGDISAGVNVSGVGAFNPPAFSQFAPNQLLPIALALAAVAGVILWRR